MVEITRGADHPAQHGGWLAAGLLVACSWQGAKLSYRHAAINARFKTCRPSGPSEEALQHRLALMPGCRCRLLHSGMTQRAGETACEADMAGRQGVQQVGRWDGAGRG